MHPASVRYIRRSLIWIIILVGLIVLANYFYSRHIRNRAGTEVFPLLSSEMVQFSEGIEYSVTEDGVLRFKILAKQVIEIQAGKVFLQEVEAFDFNPDESVHNEIHSLKAEYDRENKKVDFIGDVQLFLDSGLELHTDFLHYDMNTNIGTTQDRVQFYSESLTGEAKGLKYDSTRKLLELNSDVDFIIKMEKESPDGSISIEEFRAVSEEASCSEDIGSIKFQGNARLESDLQLLTGDTIEMAVDSGLKKLLSLTAIGNTSYLTKASGESQVLSGDRMHFRIHPVSRNLEIINVSGQAVLDFISPSEERRLQGDEIDLYLDPQQNRPLRIEGRTGVQLHIKSGEELTVISGEIFNAFFHPETQGLQNIDVRQRAQMSIHGTADSAGHDIRAEHINVKFQQDGSLVSLEYLMAEESAQWTHAMSQSNTDSTESSGTLSAAVIEMFFSRDGGFLDQIDASGDVVMAGEGADSNSIPYRRKIFADRTRFHFYPRTNRPKDMDAEGDVRVEHKRVLASTGLELSEEFRTSSDWLNAVFVPDTENILLDSASQWGNFKYEDAARSATSGRCDYDALEEIMVLSDSPEISFEMGSATGDTVTLDRNQRVLLIHGNVQSTLSENKETGFLRGESASSRSIILADAMRYYTESGDARYSKNVQLLSEAHQLQSETLDILDAGAAIEAEGNIKHYIYRNQISDSEKDNSLSNPAPKEAGDSQDVPIYIKSSRLKYLKDTNILTYSGNAFLSSSDLTLTSGVLEILLDEGGDDIVRATARENVVVHSENRECKGDVAHYNSNPKSFEVTGFPAECFDPEQGRTFSRRLTYMYADDSIQAESN